MQADAADAELYRPTSHSVQSLEEAVAAAAVYFPAPQLMQLSCVLPTVDEYLPATQSMQSAAPVVTKYLPATHSMQSKALSLPVTATYFPGAQPMQFEARLLPAMSTYLPAPQSIHARVDAVE